MRHSSLLQLGVAVLPISSEWGPGVLPNTPKCTGQPYSKELSGPKCHTEAKKPWDLQTSPSLCLWPPKPDPPTSGLPRFSSLR